MKVIEKGRAQRGWAKKCRCTGSGNGGGGCGALLLVEQEDLFQTTSCHMGETDYFVTFRCSECGVLTDINDGYTGSARLPTEEQWRAARKESER